VYRAVLAHREWGVAKIAENLRWSDDEVRDALNRLADLTLLRPSLESPGELRPVNPAMGLQALLQRQHAEVLRQQHRFTESQAAVSQLISEYAVTRRAEARDHTEHIQGLDAVQSRLEELAHRSTASCLSFMPGGGQSPPSLTASRPLDELMLQRGSAVLTLYLDSVRNDAGTLAYARWLTDLGGVVRTTPTLPLRMVLFDREVALVPIDPDNSRLGAVQLSGLGIITALVTLFEQAWHVAAPFGGEPSYDSEEPTGQERELLRLLALGLTDEVAARKLGISLRTTRRMMASIMERLGAHSRFEAGLRAKERHWISP
jgi:DNA-binding CsgD family transcriptional regulator